MTTAYDALKRVREMHGSNGDHIGPECGYCFEPWPCATEEIASSALESTEYLQKRFEEAIEEKFGHLLKRSTDAETSEADYVVNQLVLRLLTEVGAE